MQDFGVTSLVFATPNMSFVEPAAPPARPTVQLLLKSAGDRVAALLLIALLAPVLIGVALAIRLDSRGPVFFRQPRVGQHGATFMIWKFRTMHHALADAAARRQTSRDDHRVTRLGRTLRRLSLDELPQLINVLRGEMSLVGPRPHTPATAVDGRLLPEIVPTYVRRHAVKPGITGWAQINGSRGELRTDADVRRRVALDLAYIETWSLGFDLRILVLTVLREIVSTRAY
jgi:polysaccharide biosynthesis protein PslA